MNAIQEEMKVGFIENEKKYGKMVKDTYNKVMKDVLLQAEKQNEILKKAIKNN